VGHAPLEATVFEMERLRCNACGEVFTAEEPETAGADKNDETAVAMIALLKYGTGVPFKRLERLQEHLGMPLPATTQWDLMAAGGNPEPVFSASHVIRSARTNPYERIVVNCGNAARDASNWSFL